jgi:general secretion pathway protein F
MSIYQYQAYNKAGSATKGIVEADSDRHARQLLRDKGLIPTFVEKQTKSAKAYRKDKISAADLSLLTRQLATLLAAGIPVEESLRGVSEQTEKDKVRDLILGVRTKVVEGYGLAQAMNEYPIAFPELYRATVGAGEQTGRLDTVLEKLADYTEKQQETRQKIHQALIYPLLMVVVSSGIIAFLLAFVVPKIIDVFTSSGQTLPIMTVILVALSEFITSYGIVVLVLLILSWMVFKRSLTNPRFRTTWNRFLLRLPLIGFLVSSVNIARYIHTFSILFTAGVNVLDTMRVSASVVTNVVMREALEEAVNRVREGGGITLALKETHLFGAMAIHLIASGEKSGELAPMMERAAMHMDVEVQRIVDTALTLFEPMIILMMGGVVLFIVLATLLPIFSMEQLVS